MTEAAPSQNQATRRRQTQVFQDQLSAITNWHAARRAEEARARAVAASTSSREQRLDISRRMDVLRCQHEAIIQRTHEQLRESAALLLELAPRRAVIALQNAWFSRAVTDCLAEEGVDVVALPTNGAAAVGAAVAEQPDLVLVSAVLPMMTGEQVIREVRAFTPRAVVAARTLHDGQIGVLLEAGATVAFTSRGCPADVARNLCLLL